MRRAAIAAAWLLGTTVPLVVATVWMFGCCVLPFHQAMHRLMPVCAMATNSHDAQPSTPAPQKQEPAKRIVSEAPSSLRFVSAAAVHERVVINAMHAYRSFIALGALRCDRDVGIHLLDVIFRI